MNIKEIVNDPEWQVLRQSFLGTWKKQPEANIARLRSYLGIMDCPLRFRRVHNYLTGSGFRLGVISHPAIDQFLTELRAAK
jgi:hypothetical protein